MERVQEDFENRVGEIETYFQVLADLTAQGTTITRSLKNGTRSEALDTEVIETLKATSFLLLYNLVESSIRSGFAKIYESINGEVANLNGLREEYRKVWVEQKFTNMQTVSANQQSYRALVLEIVQSLVDGEPLELDPEKLKISGNLDAEQIRTLLGKHAVASHAHHQAFGGGELSTVKSQRNALAHGNLSFIECGRNYSVTDLVRIKRRTIIFIRSALRNIKKYVEKKQYAA
ncbi:MAG: hypothetical protein GKR89_34675 [Candidatus Latescibacteria bacterium]|nr:hypothetical protein [Candidatus Latescibacterota bacterium]